MAPESPSRIIQIITKHKIEINTIIISNFKDLMMVYAPKLLKNTFNY